MKTGEFNTYSTRHRSASAILVALLAMTFAVYASAQSTDRNDPTRLTSSEISSESGGARGNYFYTFEAGPGEVTIESEASAAQFSTSVTATVSDANQNQRAFSSVITTLAEGTRRGQIGRFQLDRRQSLLLHVYLEENLRSYKIMLGGAVHLGGATAATPPTPTPSVVISPPPTASGSPATASRPARVSNEQFMRRAFTDLFGALGLDERRMLQELLSHGGDRS